MKEVDWDLIISKVVDTADSVTDIKEKYHLEDYEDDEVEEKLGDGNLERCPICEWWCETSALINDENEVVGCETCREPEEYDE